jgi:phosphoribosylamine--glycine ligase
VKTLIIGSGGREHALAWKFSCSRSISGLYVAPGNAGTAEIATNVPNLDINDPADLSVFCRKAGVDLVFIGPEEPLARGVVDQLTAQGIPTFGPGRAAAVLESSKSWAKSFMQKYDIPTADYREFTDFDDFRKFFLKSKKRWVLKKNGLAAGKGVLDSGNQRSFLSFAREVLAEDSLVVEEFLEGWEVSVFAGLDGRSYLLFPPATDHKKAHENDTGPNTGGMGAICPVPPVDQGLMSLIERTIVQPTVAGLVREGLMYHGFLFFGLMITARGPVLLEYNVRLGDPETQVLLPVLNADFADIVTALMEGRAASLHLPPADATAVGVVMAAKGYPGPYRKGLQIRLPDRGDTKNQLVFHAATRRGAEGRLLTNGGRCLTVVGLGRDVYQARARAYEAVGEIHFPAGFFRSDIGEKFLKE